jgi:hypothetical protein
MIENLPPAVVDLVAIRPMLGILVLCLSKAAKRIGFRQLSSLKLQHSSGNLSRLWTRTVVSSDADGFAMRRQLKRFLPVILLALVVQIFAPIGACWAASIAASDPLARAVICHGNGASDAGQADQTSHRAHDGCCSVCSVMQTGVPIDTPQLAAAIAVDRDHARVAWIEFTPDRFASRAGSHAQARAPPSIS